MQLITWSKALVMAAALYLGSFTAHPANLHARPAAPALAGAAMASAQVDISDLVLDVRDL